MNTKLLVTYHEIYSDDWFTDSSVYQFVVDESDENYGRFLEANGCWINETNKKVYDEESGFYLYDVIQRYIDTDSPEIISGEFKLIRINYRS